MAHKISLKYFQSVHYPAYGVYKIYGNTCILFWPLYHNQKLMYVLLGSFNGFDVFKSKEIE